MQLLDNGDICFTGDKISIPKAAFDFGALIANQFNANGKLVLLASDGNDAMDFAVTCVSAGLSFFGANVIFVGKLPASAVSVLCKMYAAAVGVFLFFNCDRFCASVFDGNGCKMMQGLFEKLSSQKVCTGRKAYGKISVESRAIGDYEKFITDAFCYDLTGMCVALDMGHGLCSGIAPRMFQLFGADVVSENDFLDGDLCGYALLPHRTKLFASSIIARRADVGFVFDAVGKSVLLFDKNGTIYGVEDILLLFAVYLKECGRLVGNSVVLDGECNEFDVYYHKNGIKTIRCCEKECTYDVMRKTGSMLGGGKSELIMKEFLPVSDAILAALFVSKIVKEKNMSVSELMDIVKKL